ncbi:serendipity locus protein beta [Drosophila virilis]|uniref:Serendipity-beta, isoform A n=1 Tax=Drosophila virilis TaxID=7244 RepID=B4M6H7_DROVI|nr:serendipity locus protein beta [Drosophila virilis]XP_015026052.1 serendipity locus protein beta [Drosophila virilis]EDW59253.1 Serendipity-beta, isoform A [Drosophila virilis]KRF78769.1 Serendipity-beta, isoform B [Drosophila virilis]
MSTTRPFCFVCGKMKSVGVFQLIEGCIVPGTFKPIKDILKYFEKVINQRLDLTPTSAACNDCLEYLFNYDRLVRNLSQVQRQIANSLLNCRKRKAAILQTRKDAIKPRLHEMRTRISDNESKIVKEEPEEYASCEEPQAECQFSESEESMDDSDGEDNLDIPCHICGELFANQDSLERHIKTDNCQKNEFATCNICGIKVKNDEVLDLHMNLHEGKTELECRYCTKKFSHKRNVLRHMEVHWDKKKYQCEKCGERFSLSWLMYNHLMRHDAEEHALICEVCHQQFKTKRTYKHHLRTHQTDRPRYPCTDCEKSFVDKYTLKVHKRVHLPVEATQSATESHTINQTT